LTKGEWSYRYVHSAGIEYSGSVNTYSGFHLGLKNLSFPYTAEPYADSIDLIPRFLSGCTIELNCDAKEGNLSAVANHRINDGEYV
jgi:hypothetical protein